MQTSASGTETHPGLVQERTEFHLLCKPSQGGTENQEHTLHDKKMKFQNFQNRSFHIQTP